MKNALLPFLFLLSITNLYAQKFHFGIQGSAGASTIVTHRENDFEDIEKVYLGLSKNYLIFSHGINAYMAYTLNQNLRIAIEPGCIRKGFAKKIAIDNEIFRQNNNLDYFHIPMLAEFFSNETNVALSIGPEISFLLKANQKTNGARVDVLNSYRDKKIDLGLQIGLYYTFNKHFDMGAKGGISLTRLGYVTFLNNNNEVILQYHQRNAYGQLFFRAKL